MIVTHLREVESQAALSAPLRRAVEFLRRPDLATLADGRVEIDGDRVYAVVQHAETARPAEPVFEAHRRYLDVHYLLAGEEVIGCAPLSELRVTAAYDAATEAVLGTVPAEAVTAVVLRPGHLAVLYPDDAHAPKLAAARPAALHKIVVKVAVTPPAGGTPNPGSSDLP